MGKQIWRPSILPINQYKEKVFIGSFQDFLKIVPVEDLMRRLRSVQCTYQDTIVSRSNRFNMSFWEDRFILAVEFDITSHNNNVINSMSLSFNNFETFTTQFQRGKFFGTSSYSRVNKSETDTECTDFRWFYR